MDILQTFYSSCLTWLDQWPAGCLTFACRLLAILFLAAAAALVCFRQGNRHVFLQLLATAGGGLLAMLLPVSLVPALPAVIKLWVVVLGALLCPFLVVVLPVFLVPRLGQQQVVRRLLAGACGLLIVFQFIAFLIT